MAEGEGRGGLGRLIKMILIGLVLLLLVGAGVIAAYLFLLSSGGDDGQLASAGAANMRADGGSIENPQYLELGSFVVNLADGRRYLKTTLQLLISEQAAANYLEVRSAEVKDLVISELQTLDAEQLRDPQERELLKQRLLRKIESLLPQRNTDWKDPRPIKKVLVTEFYLQ